MAPPRVAPTQVATTPSPHDLPLAALSLAGPSSAALPEKKGMQHSKWAPKPGEMSWSEEMASVERATPIVEDAKSAKKGKTKRGHRSPEAEKKKREAWAAKQARGGRREEDEQQ